MYDLWLRISVCVQLLPQQVYEMFANPKQYFYVYMYSYDTCKCKTWRNIADFVLHDSNSNYTTHKICVCVCVCVCVCARARP